MFSLADGSLSPPRLLSFISSGIPSSPIFVSFKLPTIRLPLIYFPLRSVLTYSSPCSVGRFFFLVAYPPSPLTSPLTHVPLSSLVGVYCGHLWAACSQLNLLHADQHRVNISLGLRWKGVLLVSSLLSCSSDLTLKPLKRTKRQTSSRLFARRIQRTISPRREMRNDLNRLRFQTMNSLIKRLSC